MTDKHDMRVMRHAWDARLWGESIKYIVSPIIIIPTENTYQIFSGFSSVGRTFIAEIPSAELGDWLASRVNRELAEHTKRKIHEENAKKLRTHIPEIEIEL